jgi:hypothetical protein
LSFTVGPQQQVIVDLGRPLANFGEVFGRGPVREKPIEGLCAGLFSYGLSRERSDPHGFR